MDVEKDFDLIKGIAKEAGREGARETLRGIGVNPDDPQRAQANFIFLDNFRRGSEDTIRTIKRSAIATFIAGIITLIIWGLNFWKSS